MNEYVVVTVNTYGLQLKIAYTGLFVIVFALKFCQGLKRSGDCSTRKRMQSSRSVSSFKVSPSAADASQAINRAGVPSAVQGNVEVVGSWFGEVSVVESLAAANKMVFTVVT